MHLANKWQQVVLAHRVQLDVLDDDHFVVIRIKHRVIEDFFEGLCVALGQKLEGGRGAFGCLQQAVSLGVFTGALNELFVEHGCVHLNTYCHVNLKADCVRADQARQASDTSH